MVRSMESSRPIMAPSVSSHRASKRYSTISAAPSTTPSSMSASTTTTCGGDPRMQEIKDWNTGFGRLESQQLQQQRYAVTAQKSEDLAKLALTAKVERALGRRMTGQDAVMRPRPKKSEKSG